MFRNAGRAGLGHRKLQAKRRSVRGTFGAAGPCQSVNDPQAVAAALASLNDKPVIDRTTGLTKRRQKMIDLSNPNTKWRADKYADRLLGEQPITNMTRAIKRSPPVSKGPR